MSAITTHDQGPSLARTVPLPLNRPGGAPGSGLTGKDIWRMLRRRVWLMIITFFSIVTICTAATVAWLFWAPFYTAEALLTVAPPQTDPLGRISPDMTPREVMDRRTIRMARLVHSEQVFQRAIDAPNGDIKKTEWYNQQNKLNAIIALMEEVKVSPVPGTDLLRVTMTGRNKADLMTIVNGIADAAVDESRENAGSGLTSQIETFSRNRATVQEDLRLINVQMAQARPREVPQMESAQTRLTIEMQSLVPELTRLQGAKAQLEAAVEQLNQQTDLSGSPEVQQALAMDPPLRGLESERMGLQTAAENIRLKFGKTHPTYRQYTTRLESIEKQIVEVRKDLISRTIVAVRSSRMAALEQVKQQVTEIKEQMDTLQIKTRGLQEAVDTIRALEKKQKEKEDQLRSIDNKLFELGLVAEQQAPIVMGRRATTPREPSDPRLGIMIPGAMVLGLLIAVALAFLLEFIDTSVKSPQDVTRRVDLPMLGIIPHCDDLEDEITDVRLAWMTNPTSLMGEAFRQIRTNLLFSGPASQRRTLLIASAMPEDGRTTLSLNLAAWMARSGRKVLVVDANFRQPALHRLFPQCPSAGLSNVLIEQNQWREMVHNVEANFDILPSGPLPPNPAELLGGAQMRLLLAEAATQYDLVIIDSAPTLVVSDAAILGTLVDGVVLTVRAGANTHGVVLRARETFSRLGAHMIGVVLNAVRATAGGYLRKSYETFYDYHEPQQAALPPK